MLNKIEDIKKALGNEAYLSALALTLTLPDICGRVEYPYEESTRKRYVAWFNKYAYDIYFKYDGDYKDNYVGTEFEGETCYLLRCKLLHEGHINIKDDRIKITDFELSITSTDDNGIYASRHGVTTLQDGSKNYSVRLDVRDLCNKICRAAEQYYIANNEKGGFTDYTVKIIDLEKWGKNI